MFNRDDIKTKLDKDMRKLIIDTRNKYEKTATQIAATIGKTQTWITQIETGRIKNINNDDLISLFKCILDTSNDDVAIKYLEENQIKPSFNNEENIIAYVEEDNVPEKIMNEYKEIMEDISEGFLIFIEKIGNKQYALDTLEQIRHNMHADLSYSLSIYSKQWCKFAKLDINAKKGLLKELNAFIQNNGTECPFSAEESHN